MSNIYSFTVEEQHNSWRLDRFLVEQLPQYSRSKIQKLITGGHVLVNGKATSKHHFLSVGDRVEATQLEEAVTKPVELPSIDIVFEDEDLLVISKPAGVLVHPAPHTKPEQHTLVNFLLTHCPGIANVGENSQRPGIVHRLDRDVSGVMAIAKTQEAYMNLKQQFQLRTVGKEYRAIVHGVPAQTTGVIDLKIERSKTHGVKMAARPENEQEEGRQAHTEYTVIEARHNRYSYLSVVITTGRMHQIRAHLAAIDHPVVGDVLYTSRRYSKKTYSRLFLHAHQLRLQHPTTKEQMQFESPVPSEFSDFLSA